MKIYFLLRIFSEIREVLKKKYLLPLLKEDVVVARDQQRATDRTTRAIALRTLGHRLISGRGVAYDKKTLDRDILLFT